MICSNKGDFFFKFCFNYCFEVFYFLPFISNGNIISKQYCDLGFNYKATTCLLRRDKNEYFKDVLKFELESLWLYIQAAQML